jgi:hypothetical protein
MSFLVLSVGLLVIGVLLLTTCQTVTTVGPFSTSVGCEYPFQGYGLVFLYLAALVTILSANLLARSLQSPSPSNDFVLRCAVLSALAFVGVTLLFLIVLLVLRVA